MRHEKREDLDWLAFCYVADELSGDELEVFERRLADDQKAREAVARAVELTRAVAAVGDEAPHRVTPASRVAGVWRRMGAAGRLGWAAVAVSACVAFVLAYQHYRGTGPTAVSPPGTPGQGESAILGSRPDELAIAWSRTGEELALLQLDDRMVDSPDETETAEEFPSYLAEEPPGGGAFVSNVPPSWLLAAVQAVSGEGGAGDHRGSGPEED